MRVPLSICDEQVTEAASLILRQREEEQRLSRYTIYTTQELMAEFVYQDEGWVPSSSQSGIFAQGSGRGVTVRFLMCAEPTGSGDGHWVGALPGVLQPGELSDVRLPSLWGVGLLGRKHTF